MSSIGSHNPLQQFESFATQSSSRVLVTGDTTRTFGSSFLGKVASFFTGGDFKASNQTTRQNFMAALNQTLLRDLSQTSFAGHKRTEASDGDIAIRNKIADMVLGRDMRPSGSFIRDGSMITPIMMLNVSDKPLTAYETKQIIQAAKELMLNR